MPVFLYNLSIPHSNVSEAWYKNQLTTDTWACIPHVILLVFQFKNQSLHAQGNNHNNNKRKKKIKNERGKNKNKTKNDFCHSLVKSLSPSTKSLKSLSKWEKKEKEEKKKKKKKKFLKRRKHFLSLVKSLSPSYIPSSNSVHSKLPPNHFRKCLPLGLRMVTALSSGAEVVFLELQQPSFSQ